MFLLCIFVQKTRLFLESVLFLVILMVEPARTLIIVLMTMFLSMFVPDDGSHCIDCSFNQNNCDLNSVDDNGKCLLNLHKSSGLRIVNWRAVGDSLGYYTWFSVNGNPSTINYFLASPPEILDNTRYMRVMDPCMESIHCPFNICRNTNGFNTISSQDDSC